MPQVPFMDTVGLWTVPFTPSRPNKTNRWSLEDKASVTLGSIV